MELIDLSNPYAIYLIIGVAFNLIFDLLVETVKDEVEESKLRFTNVQRIVVMILWPFYLILLIWGLIYEFFIKTKDE